MTDNEKRVDQSTEHPADEEILKIPDTPEELKRLLDAARLEGARLVGNTVANLLNNQLSPAYGLLELFKAYKISLPPNLQAMAEAAKLGLQQATTTVRRISRLKHLVTESTRQGQFQILNLEASTEITEGSTLKHTQHS